MSIKVILFNEPPLYPGTLLKGELDCRFDSHLRVRSIKIRCYGKEHTEWQTGGKHKHTYSATHYFFQMETKLFEPESSEMKPGHYKYPFSFLLPPDLPSVFEFPYGYIRYSLKGIVDVPLDFDPRDRMDLAVISVLDITKLPQSLQQPFQANDQSMMGCCLFYNTDPVRMTAQINKLVFLPGETISINLELDNMSNNTVEDVTVKLVRCFVAHSEMPRHDTRFINEDLLKQTFQGVAPHSTETYDINLLIPLDLPVPNMTGSKILEGIYRLDVTGTASGFNRDVSLTIAEIKIGHVIGPDWVTATNLAVQSQQPTRVSGYPYPSTSGKGEDYKIDNPSLGFEAVSGAPSAPPPCYEDVTKRPY